MGKHSGNHNPPTKDDEDKFHNDVRSLPTYQPQTPYDKATERPAPVDPKPRKGY